MMNDNEQRFWWSFSFDADGFLKDPIRPVEETTFMNMKHYLVDQSCKMIPITTGPIHLILEGPTETIYYFQKREEAEDFIEENVR